jgi:S-DNA-T family DNA segregation ATPase FtsK/SpoIIIE
MAITHSDAPLKSNPLKNSRRNEIIAVALFAVSILLALCLLSYKPDDPSWNAAGQAEAHNLVGSIGANIATTLFQFVGLAAYLVPVLVIATAWRRFRTRRIHAPISRVMGLLLLVLACSALLALSNIRPLFDTSFHAGGLSGTIIAHALASGLNTVGSMIVLIAAAATGLLLATNFSFAHSYERLTEGVAGPFGFVGRATTRYNEWRARRREEAETRKQERDAARAAALEVKESERGARKAARASREAAGETGLDSAELSVAAKPVKGKASRKTVISEAVEDVEEHDRDFDEAVAVPVSRRSTPPNSDRPGSGATRTTTRNTTRTPEDAEAEEIAAMVMSASVVRTDPTAVEKENAPTLPDRSKPRTAVPAAIFGSYKMPDVEFLHPPPPHNEQDDEELLGLAAKLAEKCKEFNVTGQIKHICPGPVVTTYEFKPDPGVKYSRVTGLVDDLCLALKAESIRIDRMPGKPHVGIEVPNPTRETIHLREVVESRAFRESNSKLTIALGKTIDGLNYVADLAKMPHLLIAGATGAGKSVGVNTLIVSILYKARPDEVKFIMVDPKRLELGLYADIPHLATPIITDPKRAAISLKWAVSEMERRYKELAGWGVRNIDGFNSEVARRNQIADFDEHGDPHKPLPYIVIIIDELADLMMVSGHEVEESITRLAQMARAVGIHLVLATQRPSVDVITGLIKANFPSRISFRVSSKVDSRTIIDSNGAEQLLGRGDMLFLPPGTSRLVRVHGAFVDEAEIGKIVKHIKEQGEPDYDQTITQSDDEALGLEGGGGDRDELYEDALRICCEMKRASTSVLQRRLRIGYGRAAAILDMMERDGVIGQADGSRPRPVLGKAYEIIGEIDLADAGGVG